MSQPLVLLVIPPGSPGSTPNREGAAGLGAVTEGERAFRYAPQTVATVAQLLRQQGQRVQVLDAPALALDLGQTMEQVRAQSPALVGVLVSWATREADSAFLHRCVGEAPTVAFGPSTPWMRPDLMAATWVIQGDPAEALVVLAANVMLGQPPPQQWILAQPSPISSWPTPAWDLVPVARYSHLSLLTSRGCDEACQWCPYVVAQGERFQARAPEAVVAEMEELVQRYRPKRIIMRDPAFAADLARAKAICRLIMRSDILAHGKGVTWECESRPEHFDTELVRLLSLAGCIGIKVGLETVDADLLVVQGRLGDRAEATVYLAQVAALAQACLRWGVALRLYVMVGLPGQTLQSARETAHFVQALRPAWLEIKAFEPYPGLRGHYDALPEPAEVEQQRAILQEAQAKIASRRQPAPARWRRLLWRYVYRYAAAYRLRDGWGKGG